MLLIDSGTCCVQLCNCSPGARINLLVLLQVKQSHSSKMVPLKTWFKSEKAIKASSFMSCYLLLLFCFLISVQKKEAISIVSTSSKFSLLLLVVSRVQGKPSGTWRAAMFRPGRGKSFSQDKKHLEAIMPVDKNIAIIHQLQLRKKSGQKLRKRNHSPQSNKKKYITIVFSNSCFLQVLQECLRFRHVQKKC